jgi:hypothetical protein
VTVTKAQAQAHMQTTVLVMQRDWKDQMNVFEALLRAVGGNGAAGVHRFMHVTFSRRHSPKLLEFVDRTWPAAAAAEAAAVAVHGAAHMTDIVHLVDFMQPHERRHLCLSVMPPEVFARHDAHQWQRVLTFLVWLARNLMTFDVHAFFARVFTTQHARSRAHRECTGRRKHEVIRFVKQLNTQERGMLFAAYAAAARA